MYEFIILGLIPGTDIQVGFLPTMLAILTILCIAEVVLRIRRSQRTDTEQDQLTT